MLGQGLGFWGVKVKVRIRIFRQFIEKPLTSATNFRKKQFLALVDVMEMLSF